MDVKMRGIGNDGEWMTTKVMTAIEDGGGDVVVKMRMTPKGGQAQKRRKIEGEGQGDILGTKIAMGTEGARTLGITTRSSTDPAIERGVRACWTI
jgi:repressor of nif and glnA expression